MKAMKILNVVGIIVMVSFVALAARNFWDAQLNNGNGQVQEDEIVQGNAEVQFITLSMRNANYYPSEIKVKVNQPVEITLDKNVQGCLRSFTIREFGISKYARNPQDKILFTPKKKGTFAFSCSMGMGAGKLIVE